MEPSEWTGRARHTEAPVVEVGFLVWEDLFDVPANGDATEPGKTRLAPLRPPALERFHYNVDYVLTSALERSAGEMVRYYHDVLRAAKEHAIAPPRSRFWLTPFLLFGDGTVIPFHLEDDRQDAERVLAALESAGDGVIFDEMDQGWEVTVVADGGRLFIRHGGNDTREEYACVWCDRGALVRQVPPLRALLHGILRELESALGGDYWSSEPDPPGVA